MWLLLHRRIGPAKTDRTLAISLEKAEGRAPRLDGPHSLWLSPWRRREAGPKVAWSDSTKDRWPDLGRLAWQRHCRYYALCQRRVLHLSSQIITIVYRETFLPTLIPKFWFLDFWHLPALLSVFTDPRRDGRGSTTRVLLKAQLSVNPPGGLTDY